MGTKAISAKITIQKNMKPEYDRKEVTLEMLNDADTPIDGDELVAQGILAVQAGMAKAKAGAATTKLPAQPAGQPAAPLTVAHVANITTPLKTTFKYNLEKVPVERRNEAVKILEKAGAKYNEGEDLWVSKAELSPLAKFLVA